MSVIFWSRTIALDKAAFYEHLASVRPICIENFSFPDMLRTDVTEVIASVISVGKYYEPDYYFWFLKTSRLCRSNLSIFSNRNWITAARTKRFQFSPELSGNISFISHIIEIYGISGLGN